MFYSMAIRLRVQDGNRNADNHGEPPNISNGPKASLKIISPFQLRSIDADLDSKDFQAFQCTQCF